MLNPPPRIAYAKCGWVTCFVFIANLLKLKLLLKKIVVNECDIYTITLSTYVHACICMCTLLYRQGESEHCLINEPVFLKTIYIDILRT